MYTALSAAKAIPLVMRYSEAYSDLKDTCGTRTRGHDTESLILCKISRVG
jgi:hypothetical protein